MAESIRITLVALFFLWMCKEGVLADGLSFEALLRTVLSVFLKLLSLWVIIFDIRIGLINLKTQARAKVRASDVRLVFGWSSLVLRSLS